ncbi:NCS2 family permease [Myxococcota bacterium]|nr:NCS2 family permease [Myxococcota bacterium]MBU1381517.1 NCS2 family permease [Myxococcota bacterium]MBU1497524.1 NCS2 family permease [Myxococcota bacterium]
MIFSHKNAQPMFVRGDLDGFFGLALDNLIQYLLIISLGTAVLGFPVSLIIGKILPGAAISLLLGNLFYAWQAQKVSAETGRKDVTALPYGINTVSLFAYVFLVMLPVKVAAQKSGMSSAAASNLAWQIGLGACFVSGLIEFAGSFVARFIRKLTPRAALLSTLAGIAISFIAIDFALKTFESPLLAMLPLAVILATYFSGIRLPFRIPGGALAVGLGTATAWLIFHFTGTGPVSSCAVCASKQYLGFHPPVPVFGDLYRGLTHPMALQFIIPVMLPMGLFNVLGSLQNIESAEAAGDRFKERPSLLVNGLGSMVGAVFGSCYPTTIYIGHPGWKAMGARSGYSILNGVFYTLVALFGLSSFVAAIIPIESGMAIVLWIGIIITAQAFSANSKKHAVAVAVGLFPAIAAWGLLVVTQTLGAVANAKGNFAIPGEVLANPAAFKMAGLHLDGLVAISQGFMFTCIIWASMSVYLIERKFLHAAFWALAGSLLAYFGFIHAGKASPSGGIYTIYPGAGMKWALSYIMIFVFFVLLHFWFIKSRQDLEDPVSHV